MRVYLDNAATTQLDPLVLEAMLQYYKDNFGNPSSIHAFGRVAKAGIEKSRKTIAGLLNASTGEIFFTSGGTEAVNMAVKCAVMDLGVEVIITSKLEHHCVLHSVKCMKQRFKTTTAFVSNDADGNFSLDSLSELLQKYQGKKVLVSLIHGNNEIGNITNLSQVSALCREHNAFLHSDTVQTIGHYPLDLQSLDIDFISGSAHKFHGPKGVGFIYINENLRIKPFIDGGAQERNMRAGTENIAGIAGMAKALELAIENFEVDKSYITSLKTYLAESLMDLHPDLKVFGNYPDNSLYTVLNIGLPAAMPGDMVLLNLDINQIAVSGGSACSSGSNTGSHVIQAIHPEQELSSVRFSFSKYNTKEELDYVIEQVGKLIPKLSGQS